MSDFIPPVTTDSELAHFGVKGMRWGVRRDQRERVKARHAANNAKLDRHELTDQRTSRVSPRKPAPKKSETLPPRPKAEMSDAELRARIERLQLEKRYRELTAETKTKAVGRQIVEKILQDSVQDAGKTLLKDVLVTQGRKALSGVLDGKK